MQKTIKWTCKKCGEKNEWEMHAPNACPAAHFPSMICEHCGDEIEGCLCYQPNPHAQALGKLSAAAHKAKGHGSEYYKQLAKKRWAKK